MKPIEEMTDEEILAEAQARFSRIIRTDREREVLARLTTPQRRRRLTDLWDAEGPFLAFPPPTLDEARELDRIEAAVERGAAQPSIIPPRQR